MPSSVLGFALGAVDGGSIVRDIVSDFVDDFVGDIVRRLIGERVVFACIQDDVAVYVDDISLRLEILERAAADKSLERLYVDRVSEAAYKAEPLGELTASMILISSSISWVITIVNATKELLLSACSRSTVVWVGKCRDGYFDASTNSYKKVALGGSRL